MGLFFLAGSGWNWLCIWIDFVHGPRVLLDISCFYRGDGCECDFFERLASARCEFLLFMRIFGGIF